MASAVNLKLCFFCVSQHASCWKSLWVFFHILLHLTSKTLAGTTKFWFGRTLWKQIPKLSWLQTRELCYILRMHRNISMQNFFRNGYSILTRLQVWTYGDKPKGDARMLRMFLFVCIVFGIHFRREIASAMNLKRVKKSRGWRWGMSFLQSVLVAQVYFKRHMFIKTVFTGEPSQPYTVVSIVSERYRCCSMHYAQVQWTLAHALPSHLSCPALTMCMFLPENINTQHPNGLYLPWIFLKNFDDLIRCKSEMLQYASLSYFDTSPRMVGWCVFYSHRLLPCFLWPSCCAAFCWSLWSQDLASQQGCRHNFWYMWKPSECKTPKTEYIYPMTKIIDSRKATNLGSTGFILAYLWLLSRLWLCSTSVELPARPVFQAARKLMETEKLGRWVRSGEMLNARNYNPCPQASRSTNHTTTWHNLRKNSQKFSFSASQCPTSSATGSLSRREGKRDSIDTRSWFLLDFQWFFAIFFTTSPCWSQPMPNRRSKRSQTCEILWTDLQSFASSAMRSWFRVAFYISMESSMSRCKWAGRQQWHDTISTYAVVICRPRFGKKHQFCNFGDVHGIFCAQVAGQQQGDLTLSLSEVLCSTQKTSQKDQDTRRLVAATAGYISVLYHGRASGMH